MHQPHPDPLRIERWRDARRQIRLAAAAERDRLLERFGDEIRALTPLAARAAGDGRDIGARVELATALGVVIGAWLEIDPLNPDWPSRDRFFPARENDLIALCSALSGLGFFQPEIAAKLAAACGAGDRPRIPGLELPGASPREMLAAARESAIESGKSKRRWRDHFGPLAGVNWANPRWRDSAAAWRTCVLMDHLDDALPACRDLARQGGDAPAGLVVLIALPREDAANTARQWRDSGWETLVVGRADALGLYESLTAPADDRPLAIMLALGEAAILDATAATRRETAEGQLIGELSDEQFNAIMGESLQF